MLPLSSLKNELGFPMTSKKMKTKGCGLFLRASQPQEQDIEHLLKNIDAAYVVTHDSRLFYVKRADKNVIAEIPVSPEQIQNIMEQIGYKSTFEAKETRCINNALSQKQFGIFASITGHVHQPAYVAQFIQSIKKLENINDFQLRHKALFIESIESYRNFINGYLQDNLTALGIYPGKEFYEREWFTLSKRTLHGNLSKQIATNLSPNASSAEIEEKLKAISDVVGHFLSDEDAKTVIEGYRKLQRLIPPTDKVTLKDFKNSDLYRSVLSFNDDLRDGQNTYVDFLMGAVKTKKGIAEVVDEGTGKQQRLIAALKRECQKYQQHLEEGLAELVDKQENGEFQLKNPGSVNLGLKLKVDKYNRVQQLVNIFSDESKDAGNKISQFTSNFRGFKKSLSDHRDDALTLFFKNVAFIVSSAFFGAGLIYSSSRKETCNFFKSHGEIAVEKIEKHLEHPFYQAEYNW